MDEGRRAWIILAGLAVGVGGLPEARGGEPSAEYQAQLKRTLELRKQRRRGAASATVGVIVPYPMPPALVVRQTPEAHDEIGALLSLLRYGRR